MPYYALFGGHADKEPEIPTVAPWPYTSWKKKREAKKEELPERKTFFYASHEEFINDVQGGVV